MLELLRQPKPKSSQAGEDDDEDDALVEVVVLGKVLGADINFGYQEMGGVILKALNGKAIKGLADLAHQLELQLANLAEGGNERAEASRDDSGAQGWLEFELSNSQKIVLDAQGCRDTEAEVLAAYGLASATSEVLERDVLF